MSFSRVSIIVGLLLLPAAPRVSSQVIRDKGRRQIFCLNERWSYLENDVADVGELAREKREWEQVSLPHTWNKFDAVDQTPGYRRSGYHRHVCDSLERIAMSSKDSSEADMNRLLRTHCPHIVE